MSDFDDCGAPATCALDVPALPGGGEDVCVPVCDRHRDVVRGYFLRLGAPSTVVPCASGDCEYEHITDAELDALREEYDRARAAQGGRYCGD